MNAPNVRNAMNASKSGTRIWGLGAREEKNFSGLQSLAPLAIALLIFLPPTTAHAQGAAPGMSGVQEVIVQYTHFGDAKNSDSCGLERESIAASLNKILSDSGTPAIPAAIAKPPMMGVARIELVPEIWSLAQQGLDCTSWVSLSAQSQSNVHIPPLDVLRNVKIVYWQKGALIASGQANHAEKVNQLLSEMAQQFAKQYRLDQPPALPKQPL